jgi:hypothetical protein
MRRFIIIYGNNAVDDNNKKGGGMEIWFRFFLGTPQRFLATLGVVGLISVLLDPSLLSLAVERFIIALSPLFQPVIALVLVFCAARFILFGRRGP